MDLFKGPKIKVIQQLKKYDVIWFSYFIIVYFRQLFNNFCNAFDYLKILKKYNTRKYWKCSFLNNNLHKLLISFFTLIYSLTIEILWLMGFLLRDPLVSLGSGYAQWPIHFLYTLFFIATYCACWDKPSSHVQRVRIP